MSSHQEILTRGQQTVGVWDHFAPTLTFGTLALAGHQADVAGLSPADQAVVDAEGVIDDKRDVRTAKLDVVQEVATRLPRLAANSIAPDDSLQDDIEQAQKIDMQSEAAILDRGRMVLTLWTGINAHWAAATPPLPPLTLPKPGGGTWAVADLAAAIPAVGVLAQEVWDAAGPLSDKRSLRRNLAARTDRNNKRWYDAWSAHFPAGTPEHDALSQITTEEGGGSTVPGAATIGAVTVDDTNAIVVTGMAAARATSFAVQLLAPGESEFADHTTAPGPNVTFGPLDPGSWQVRIAGRNAQGSGAWSAPGAFEAP